MSKAQAPAVLEPLLSIVEVAKLLGVSKRLIERDRAAGKFPRQDLTIGKLPRWKPETIRAWIESRASA